MSRSYRKNPIASPCGGSEKLDKRTYWRGYRKLVKTLISKWKFDDIPKDEGNRHGGNWNFKKDGKMYFDPKKHSWIWNWLR